MVQLTELQNQVRELSEEDRKGLVAFLLHGFTDAPSGPDDEEVQRRDVEMASVSSAQNEFPKSVDIPS